jgi:hypothetical protein
MALTEAQVKYYDELEDTIGTPGWKTIVEEAKSEIYQLQADALDAPNWDMVNYIRGKAEQLAYLVNLQGISSTQKAALEQNDEVEEGELIE